VVILVSNPDAPGGMEYGEQRELFKEVCKVLNVDTSCKDSFDDTYEFYLRFAVPDEEKMYPKKMKRYLERDVIPFMKKSPTTGLLSYKSRIESNDFWGLFRKKSAKIRIEPAKISNREFL
jgi:hypothetical protein